MAELISATGSFITEGERRAAEELKQLPDSWLVICNKTLPTSNGRSYEIDFVVVGKRWIFLLDEKSWRGKIRGNEEQWVRVDGFSERSPLAKADYVAKVLAGHIGWKVPALKSGSRYVRGGVLLSATDQLPQILDSRAASGIFLLTDVCQHLREIDSQGGNPLVGQVHNLVKKALVDLSERPAVPGRINNLFTVEDAIAVRPGVRLFHATMDGGESFLLMIYDLGRDPLAAHELRNFYLREFKALRELYSTGLVAEVAVPFEWSDDFLILPIVPLKGKPLSVYPRPETREELALELLLAAASFKGLDIIHSKNILHRAIGPDTVYVLQGGQAPKIAFTNFFAARLGTSTIAAPLDKLAFANEDPYASLDLAVGYEHATPATDIFSLALVFLERVAGVSVAAIRASVESEIIFPDLQKRWSILPADFAAKLSSLFQQIVTPEHYVPPPQAKEIVSRLSELARLLRAGTPQEEETYLLDRRFKVQRVLGQGTMAKTYLASYTDYADAGLGPFVLKRFLKPEEVYQQAVAEYRSLHQIKSKYLPSISEIYPQQGDVHIKMEYIPGQTLKELESTFPWPLERWWPFAQDMMNAIDELEKKHLLHRDIKPENIILYDEGQYPVLIDFGFAIQQGASSSVRAAGTPLYLPPEALTALTPPSTCDRYAAGIVLFRMLTGSLPFELTGTRRKPRIPDQVTSEKVRKIAAVLLRVVSNDPQERPTSIAQVRNDLQTAVLALEEPVEIRALAEQINPWVDDIRSLYRNSESGNANNRGLDTPFVRETYVPTALDLWLLPAIFDDRPKAVFLSGNPGDGKTAFLEQVREKLEDEQATFLRNDADGWECKYKGHTFRSCYDASEAFKGLSADEQLAQKLQGLEGTLMPDTPLTVLIAINDGRLMDYFDRQKERFHWLAEQIERFGDESEVEHVPVWVVDLKRRAFVNLPEVAEPSIFTRVLQSLVDQERWQICETCAAAAVCPIRNNAAALRKRSISKWLEYLLLLTHLRRQRHMTMRDLRSAIAYLITGNSSCQQVHEARHGEEAGASLINLNYWRSAFAPLEMNDELLREMINLDPARFAHPQLDRFLHFHQSPEEADARRLLFADSIDLSLQRFKDEREWIAATKRRLYFEISKATIEKKNGSRHVPYIRRQQLLPYQYAKDFVALLDDRLDDERIAWIREQLALGILHSDGIVEDVPPGKLSVQVSASEEQQLVVLKQFPLEDFEVYAEPRYGMQMIEKIPEIVIFEHTSGMPSLEITVDLFELLMRMANGLLPDAQEYQPLLEDLKRFKDALLLQETRDLVLIENQHRVHYITQRNGNIIRTGV
jgi:serine/threonine protein kinase